MLYQSKKDKRYFLLNDSDNYGYDCYSFFENKEQDDGFVPFCADCLPTDEPERSNEVELIRKWNEEMTEDEKINLCLSCMGSSLQECELIEDEDLEEELQENC